MNWTVTDFTWDNPDNDSFNAQYNDGDDVTFPTLAANTITVQAGGVAPNSMTFSGTNGTQTFTGGDITGLAGNMILLKDYGLTFNGGDVNEDYNFTGDVDVTQSGAKIIYQPTIAGSHQFGSGTILLGVNAPISGTQGGQLQFSNTAGVTLANDITIGNQGDIQGRGFGNIAVNGDLFFNTVGDVMDGDITLNTGGTFNSSRLTTFSGTITSGTESDLVWNVAGSNPDHTTTIAGAGGWGITSFTRNGTANPNLVFTTDPNTVFSNVIANDGLVVMNTGGTFFGSTTPDIDFNLQMNSDSGLAGTTTLLNIRSGGSLGGNGTVAARTGLGGGGGSYPLDVDVTVQTGGEIAPGTSAGLLTISGDLTFSTGGTLTIEITSGGAVAGTDYDQLIVDGTAAGFGLSNLVVQVDPSLTLGDLLGDTLTILTSANDLSGLGFNSVTFSGAPLMADVVFGNGFIELSNFDTTIPEPSSFLLMVIGGMVMVSRRRRRRR